MSVISVTYEDFQTANQAFVADGGIWLPSINVIPAQSIKIFWSIQKDYCDGYCLVCIIYPQIENPTYQVKHVTNISVDMSQYGGATALDFTWSYWPIYTAYNLTSGTTVPVRSQVNELTFDDVMVARDTVAFYADHTWAGSPISHSGTTSVSPSGNRAFITISISYTTLPNNAVPMDNYVKDISFKLTTPTTPTQSVGSGATSSESLTNGTSSTVASGSLTLPPVTFLSDVPASSPSASSLGLLPTSSSESSQASKVPTAVFGGIAAGVVVLIAVFVIAFVLYRRRKRVGQAPSGGYEVSPTIYPHEKQGLPGSSTVLSTSTNTHVVATPTSISQHQQPRTRPGPSSERMLIPPNATSGIQDAAASTVIYDPPPIYNDDEEDYDSDGEEEPTALALFAIANRELISDDLEARLAAAGYDPADNPDNLSEEQWIRWYNVTKLELMRLRNLYHSGRQRSAPSHEASSR